MQISYQYQGKGHVKSLEKSAVIVGRPNSESEVDIDLSPDTTVSRIHARLWREDDTSWIEDLGSRYGTTINGHGISGKQSLNEGDEVQIGQTILLVNSI